jgi:hypothetical protein
LTPENAEALFTLMRKHHVFVFRDSGVEIQMSATAWVDPAPLSIPGLQQEQHGDVPVDDMPPELAGPTMAIRALRRDPTDPDAEIDDAAEHGDDLPGYDG